jgi:hypothetical protein
LGCADVTVFMYCLHRSMLWHLFRYNNFSSLVIHSLNSDTFISHTLNLRRLVWQDNINLKHSRKSRVITCDIFVHKFVWNPHNLCVNNKVFMCKSSLPNTKQIWSRSYLDQILRLIDLIEKRSISFSYKFYYEITLFGFMPMIRCWFIITWIISIYLIWWTRIWALSINVKMTQYIVFDSNRRTITSASQVILQSNVLEMGDWYE